MSLSVCSQEGWPGIEERSMPIGSQLSDSYEGQILSELISHVFRVKDENLTLPRNFNLNNKNDIRGLRELTFNRGMEVLYMRKSNFEM